MTYEYWSNVHKMIVSTRRPLRVVLRMWMTPIRMAYIKTSRWTQNSPRRKSILAVLALGALLVLYEVLRS